jgi:hypothetical protein
VTTSSVFVGVDTLNALVGEPFSLTLTTSGGTAPFFYTETGLPAGLVLSEGVISGKPTTVGTFPVVITLSDSSSPPLTDTAIFSIAVAEVVAPAAVVLAPVTNQAATVGTKFSLALHSSGGAAPWTYGYKGNPLPAGLSISGNVISGTPTTVGITTVTATVTDSSSPPSSDAVTFEIVVAA